MLAMAAVGKNTVAAGRSTQNTTEQNTGVGTEHVGEKQGCSTNTERRNLYQRGESSALCKRNLLWPA